MGGTALQLSPEGEAGLERNVGWGPCDVTAPGQTGLAAKALLPSCISHTPQQYQTGAAESLHTRIPSGIHTMAKRGPTIPIFRWGD